MTYTLQDQIELKDFIIRRVLRIEENHDDPNNLEELVAAEVNSHTNLKDNEKKYITNAAIIGINKLNKDDDCGT